MGASGPRRSAPARSLVRNVESSARGIRNSEEEHLRLVDLHASQLESRGGAGCKTHEPPSGGGDEGSGDFRVYSHLETSALVCGSKVGHLGNDRARELASSVHAEVYTDSGLLRSVMLHDKRSSTRKRIKM